LIFYQLKVNYDIDFFLDPIFFVDFFYFKKLLLQIFFLEFNFGKVTN